MWTRRPGGGRAAAGRVRRAAQLIRRGLRGLAPLKRRPLYHQKFMLAVNDGMWRFEFKREKDARGRGASKCHISAANLYLCLCLCPCLLMIDDVLSSTEFGSSVQEGNGLLLLLLPPPTSSSWLETFPHRV